MRPLWEELAGGIHAGLLSAIQFAMTVKCSSEFDIELLRPA
jgi:hypothetical protein